MAKRTLANRPEKRDRIIELVALWKSRPHELREQKTLGELARAHDLTANTDFYTLANGPEVLMKVITTIAGTALDDSAEVLSVLAAQAKTGHTRSAEIYLEWVRKVVTDASMIEYIKPTHELSDTLQEISNGAQEMLKVARRLSTNEKIDQHLQAVAVEANYVEPNTLPEATDAG